MSILRVVALCTSVVLLTTAVFAQSTCSPGSSFCQKGEPSSWTCCEAGTICCEAVNLRWGNTSQCILADDPDRQRCCPAWYQVETDDGPACPATCANIDSRRLCNDKSYNSSCDWSGTDDGGFCQEAAHPVCHRGTSACVVWQESGGTQVQCCRNADERCVAEVGCVPNPPVCEAANASRESCTAASSQCYYCAQNTPPTCINTLYQRCGHVPASSVGKCDERQYEFCAADSVQQYKCCGDGHNTSVCCPNGAAPLCCKSHLRGQAVPTFYCCYPAEFNCGPVDGPPGCVA